MKSRKIVILILICGFVLLVGTALMREVRRDQQQLRQSVSGLVEVDPKLYASGLADIVRTDRLAVFLVDAETHQPVALKFESPLVPPQTISIGQQDAEGGAQLTGKYYLVAISDKDGEVFKVSRGEVYGRSSEAVPLGTQGVRIVLDAPFQGSLTNAQEAPAGPFAGSAEPGPPERTIAGTVQAAPALAGQVQPGDRLIILLFDPEAGRPAAVRILPNAHLPQPFSISVPAGVPLRDGYSLRILTDRDNNPFNAVPGEIIGRSPGLVAPGTEHLNFVMDQPYTR